MPKPVFIESRNLTANFPDDATQEEINAAIVELFPRNGQDVAYDLSKFKEAGGKDSEFIANISDEDYIRLNNYRADKKLSTGEFFGIAGEALGTIVGDAFGGLKAAVTEAGEGVLESAARGVGAGTIDLVNLGQKLITPNQRIPTLDEFVGKPITRLVDQPQPANVGLMNFVLPSEEEGTTNEQDYVDLIRRERTKELEALELAEISQDLIEGAPVPEVAKGASYIDALTLAGLAKSITKAGVKSVFKKTAQAPITTTARPIPGVAATIETGESVIPEAVRQNAEAFATKVGEGARKAGFTGVQLGAGAVKKTADLGTAVIDAANKIGLGDSAIRGAVGAAIGYQQGGQEGALQGALAGAIIPKVARGGLRAVSGTADFIGAAAKVGKSGPSRTGIFERMAQAADISPQARNFAEKVLFTQPLVQATGEGLRQAATRSLIGAPVGAALGYAADGQEGAAAGLGAGVGISVLGGAIDAGIDSIKTLAGKSTARSQRNAIGDIRSFVNDIPDDVSRTGYAELMDKAIKIAGPERAADMLDSLRIAEGMGATVEIVPPSQRSKAFNAFDYSGGGGGKIIINPDRMNAGSVAHETFHQFFNVGLKTELQQALRDLYLGRKDADGNVIQQGLWDDTEFSKRAAQLAERYKDNPEGYAYALKQADILNNPAGFSPEAIDQARMFIIDEMTAEYSEAFMGRSRPGTFNPDRLPLWHRQMLQRMDDIILNRISDKVYGDRNIKDPTAPFTDDNGKPIRVPQLDSVLKRAWSNKMSRERGQTAGKIGKPKEVVIPTKPRDLVVFAQATFGATRDVLGSDEQGNPRILTDAERKQQAKADFEEAKAKYQTLSDDDKAKVSVTDRTGQPVDINSPNAQIRITSQTPESVFEQFLQVAKDRGMGNQQISHMRQLFASMAANEGPTFNTVNNPVYKFNKRTGQMRAETRPPTRQEIYPLLIHVNSVGGFNVQYVDMSRVKANAQKILDNPQYKGIWNGMDDFMNDFKRSLQNLSADNAIPSAELLGNGNAKIGAVKRDLIAESMNVTLPKRLEYANQPVIDPLTLLTSAGKERRVGGSAIRDFRIERLTEVTPTNERMKVVQENAYERLVRRYQPSAFTKETLPNGEAMTNPDGYRILKQTGGKLFRVYDDKGELIGTASTETAAMKKAQSDAAKTTNNALEKSSMNFAEIDAKPVKGETDVFTTTKNTFLRFQPNENVDLANYIGKTMIALPADRMGIGYAMVGPKGKEQTVPVKSQGGAGYMGLLENAGWAFSDEKAAKSLLGRLRKVAKPGEDSVIAAITAMSPINHLKNQTGQLAYVTALQAALDSKQVSLKDLNLYISNLFQSVAKSKAKLSAAARSRVQAINSFDDFKRAVTSKSLNFAEMTPILNKMQLKGTKSSLPLSVQKEIGISAFDVARQTADARYADVPFGTVVALVEIPINQTPVQSGFHYSYPWAVSGKSIGFLSEGSPVSQLTSDPRIYNKKGVLRAQPLQTVLPELDLAQQFVENRAKQEPTSTKRFQSGTDYRGTHKAPTGEFGEASLDSMDKTYPSDIYTMQGWRFYGDGDAAMDKKAHQVVMAMKGKPNAVVTVYRSVPKGASTQINPGDWVTTVRDYAKMHGERFDEGMDILSKKIKASELFTEGNSLFEFGWSPKEDSTSTKRFQPDAASPSILNGSNGTRIIKSPSGKFRVYSVTGTLLGIRDTEQAAKKLATK